MIIHGSQCTVCWYVDDNKVSHVDENVIDMMVDEIEANFGELSRSKGNKYTFLGMDIEILPDKKVAISTLQHIEKVISDLGEEIKGDVANPAKSKLFNVSTSCNAEIFHKLVAKLLWITQRSRPDLETCLLPMHTSTGTNRRRLDETCKSDKFSEVNKMR